MGIYAGDELYGDEVTSGPVEDQDDLQAAEDAADLELEYERIYGRDVEPEIPDEAYDRGSYRGPVELSGEAPF